MSGNVVFWHIEIPFAYMDLSSNRQSDFGPIFYGCASLTL